MGFEGIPVVVVLVDRLDSSLERLRDDSNTATTAVKGLVYHMEIMHLTMSQTPADFVALFKNIDEANAKIDELDARLVAMHGGGDLTEMGKLEQERGIAGLQRLSTELAMLPGLDANNSWTKLVRDQVKAEIVEVMAGRMKLGDAISELQRFLSNFYGAFQQALAASPDRAMRDLLLELERFINSGRL